MPRDVIPTERKLPETEAEFLAASDEDCLRALVRELRQPTIPHVWDFARTGGPIPGLSVIERAWAYMRGRSDCGSTGCAIGLTHARFGMAGRDRLGQIINSHHINSIFGFFIDPTEIYEIYGVPHAQVTRGAVAAAIEAHLAR